MIVKIVNQRLGWYVFAAFAVIAGISGLSIWEIKERTEEKVEVLISEQFKEPRIQKTLEDVAVERASTLISE